MWNAWRTEHWEIWPELGGANLYAKTLREANLYKADLYGGNLGETDLSRANLNGANLSRATLREAHLYSTSLNRADLSGADLRDVIGLTQARLDEAISDSDTQLPSVDE